MILLLASAVASTTFICHAPEAKEVKFASEVTSWNAPKPMTRTDRGWIFHFDLPKNGRIEYKFVVDGEYRFDPTAARVPNGLGGENSSLTGPEYRWHGLEKAPKNPWVRETITVSDREIVIFRPRRTQLPVLILADGSMYEQYVKAPQVAANLLDQKRIQPFALVLVTPRDRMKEYWREVGTYVDWVTGPLVAALKSKGYTLGRREDVFVGGASLGGFQAWQTALRHGDRVAGILCQSPAFQVERASTAAETIARMRSDLRAWIDVGDYEQELTRETLTLHDRLKAAKRSFHFLKTPEGHNTTAWQQRLDRALMALLPAQIRR